MIQQSAPPEPAVQLELGNIHHVLGDHDRAIHAYCRALAAAPDFVEAHANLAVVYHIIGRNETAQEHALRAVQLDPGRVAPRVTLAAIEGALHGFETTLRILDEVYALDPADLSARLAAIYAYAMLERYPEALEAALRAVEVAPDSSVAREAVALCLRNLGRYDEAFDALDRAEQLTGSPSGAVLAARGGLCLDCGQTEVAAMLFERALMLQPENAATWLDLVDVRSFRANDPLIDAMEELLKDSVHLRTPKHRLAMHFALGKAHDKAGNTDVAFEHFAHGNRLKREALTYSIEGDERELRAIAGALSATAMGELAGSSEAKAQPIFIVGMPRSGTTLVEQILASLPGVHGAGETQCMPDLLAAFPFAGGPAGSGIPAVLTRAEVAALGRLADERFGTITPPATRVIDKLTGNFARAGLIHLMLPAAKIVHCRRDPLDTTLSCYTTLFAGRLDYTYDLSELARYYLAYDQLMQHWREVLPAHALFELSYEALVGDFEGTVRALLEFCELPWDDACRRFNETKRPVRSASRTQVRRPLYASSIGNGERYCRYLAPLPALLSERR